MDIERQIACDNYYKIKSIGNNIGCGKFVE